MTTGANSANPNRRLLMAALVFGLPVLIILVCYVAPITPLLVGALVFSGALPLWLNRHRPWKQTELIVLVSLMFSATATGRAILFLWQPFGQELSAGYVMGDLNDALNLAMSIALLGFASLLIGYYLPWGRRLAQLIPFPRGGRCREVSFASISLYCGIIGILATYVFTLDPTLSFLGVLERFSNFPLQVFVNLLSVSAFFIWAHVFRKGVSRNRVLWAIGLTTALMLTAFHRGGKGLPLFIIVGIAFAVHHFRSPIRIRHILLIALLVIFVITPIDTDIKMSESISYLVEAPERGGLYYEVRRLPLLREAPNPVIRVKDSIFRLVSRSWDEFFELSVWRVADRLQAFNSIMAITQAYPPYLNGQGIIQQIREGLVPRFLSPTIDRSDWYGEMSVFLGGTPLNQDAVTPIGDLYRNFGPLGVFPGMILMGIVFRCLYEWFARMIRLGNPLGWLFYLGTLNILISGEVVYIQIFLTTFKMLIVLLLFFVFLNQVFRLFPNRTGGMVATAKRI